MRSRLPPFRRFAFWALIVLSLVSLLFAPLGQTIDQVKAVAPWVGLGLLASELLFIAGLALMAWSLGIKLGLNPLAWRSRFDNVIVHLNRSTAFWVGLTINTIGAVGTGLVLVVAVVAGLPRSAWGLLVLPLADLSLTAAVRAAVVSGVRQPAQG